jgi:hypothetical protein
MASGHGYRDNRPNTWLLDQRCKVKILLANPEPSTDGSSVWTGRALQAESDDLEVMGLALLYPALNGTFVFLAIMDIRARSISFASRPRRPYGPPDHERAGETFSLSPHFDSQTSAGKPTLTFGVSRSRPLGATVARSPDLASDGGDRGRRPSPW